MKQPIDTEIEERLRVIFDRVAEAAERSGRKPEEVQIMAVTKTVPPARVNSALACGIRLIGENRVQEFLEKREEYDISSDKIHFIGHLQTNKVKYIIDKVNLIESVSSIKLAEEISRHASASGILMNVLAEVNIAAEDSKSGFLEADLSEAVQAIAELPGIRLKGLMCIPQKGSGDYYFAKMYELFTQLREQKISGTEFSLLSMGMSGDYEDAIRRGSNLVRLGSAIFGART